MNVDLSSLYSKTIDKIEVNTKISFSSDELENTKIKKLEDVNLEGYFYIDSSEQLKIDLTFDGVMILEDDISLDDVEYPFSGKIDEFSEENLKSFENILDLKEILWENIVLEIPLKFTKVENLEEFNGDGWKLVSENELSKRDNPFQELLKDFKEE